MAELLLEILSEEIPARMQARAAADLKRLVTQGLKDAGLEFTKAEAFTTPRRLVLVVDGLPEKQPDVSEERKGPRVDAPDQAIKGFKGSLPDSAKIEQREIKGKTSWFAVMEKKGRPLAEVLIGLIQNAVNTFPWPKSMKWIEGEDFKWVRPIQGVLCLFDGEAVKIGLDQAWKEKVATVTCGHRFLAPEPFEVKDFADYQEKLRAAKVMLDAAERKALISEQAAKLAEAEGLTVKPDEGLLAEVAGLVEWPVVRMGRIDDAFMDVPGEVLATAMRKHQKYFSCLDGGGNLANRFIVVTNIEASDGGAAIVAGNERVLRARLSDAKYFWDQDRKRSLASRAPELSQIVFHAKLGNLDEKADRVQALATEIAAYVPGADRDKVRSAARLAKADLTSNMVGEFPELQGVMGRYYALADGENAEVAEAIAEHYGPLGPNDACPSAPVGVCVALADKIDTLAGFWSIDEKPTGSKDPFALRRAALGVIRLILENDLRIPLAGIFEKSKAGVGKDLLSFFADRLKVYLKEKGVRHDHVDAVFALGGEDDLVRLLSRLDALATFIGSEDGGSLLTAYRRAANILRIEEKKDGESYAGSTDPELLAEAEEIALYRAIETSKPAIEAALSKERFDEAMAELSKLRAPVDAFFDHVTVNCDEADRRRNRLRLLSEIRSNMDAVADFSRIEGGER